jgi:TcpE family
LSDKLVVRSYRRVFRLDRRIYRVDRFLIPVPGGVPLVGVLWFLGALLFVLLARLLPGLGAVLALLSPPLRYLILPAAIAVLATQLAPDGRSGPRFALTWLSHHTRARRRSAGRPVRRENEQTLHASTVRCRPDEHAPELRRAGVRGPARVTFRDNVLVMRGRRGITRVRPAARATRRNGRGRLTRELEVAANERLEIRP